jgi:hypothetical protein
LAAPNPASPKPATITAVAAAKRAESFISPCYQCKLCIKITEAERKLWLAFDGSEIRAEHRNT